MKTIKLLLAFFSFFLILFSCKKTSTINYTGTKFELNTTYTNDVYALNWNKINSNDFVRYEVLRSNNPIANPSPNDNLSDKIIFTTTDRDKISFNDSTGLNLESVYYRVFAVLKDRIIPTNEIKFNTNNKVFLGSNTGLFFPEIGNLYLFSSATDMVTIYNYKNNSTVAENIQLNISKPYNYYNIIFSNYNNEPRCYMLYSTLNNISAVDVFDATNFNLLKTIQFGNNSYVSSIALYKNFIYTLNSYSPYSIKKIDLATGNLISTIGSNSSSASKILFTPSKNYFYNVSSYSATKYSVDSMGDLTRVDSVSPSSFTFYPQYFTCNSQGDEIIANYMGTVLNANFQEINSSILNSGSAYKFQFVNNDQSIITLMASTSSFAVRNLLIFNANNLQIQQTIPINIGVGSISNVNFYYDSGKVCLVFSVFNSQTGQQNTIIRSIPITI